MSSNPDDAIVEVQESEFSCALGEGGVLNTNQSQKRQPFMAGCKHTCGSERVALFSKCVMPH